MFDASRGGRALSINSSHSDLSVREQLRTWSLRNIFHRETHICAKLWVWFHSLTDSELIHDPQVKNIICRTKTENRDSLAVENVQVASCSHTHISGARVSEIWGLSFNGSGFPHNGLLSPFYLYSFIRLSIYTWAHILMAVPHLSTMAHYLIDLELNFHKLPTLSYACAFWRC